MLKIFKNVAAESDLVELWGYTFEHWGANQADKYLDQIDDVLQLLAENPHIGKNCDKLRAGYFCYPAKRHTIFYKIEMKKLRIIRVLGGEMNHIQHLNDSE